MNKYQEAFFGIKANDAGQYMLAFCTKDRQGERPILQEGDTVLFMRLADRSVKDYLFQSSACPCEILRGGTWSAHKRSEIVEVSLDAPIEAVKLKGLGVVDDLVLTVKYKEI